MTSNRALEEWPQLFGDPLLASAGLDRLFHNAHALVITGASFRARGRRGELLGPPAGGTAPAGAVPPASDFREEVH